MVESEVIADLLNQPESDRLDFKEKHRPFGGAEEEQAGFLKDIIAFANTRRQGDAFLLVGVRYKHGEPAVVVGQDDHPDQASIQQFLDGKTNRPIRFDHSVVRLGERKIGVYRITKEQERPIFLKKDFAKGLARANACYVRRGSSTDIMTPDEILQLAPLTRLGGEWNESQGRQIKGMVDRWLKIFDAHDVQQHWIPQLLPQFSIPLDMLTDWRDTARLVQNRELRIATCELFNVTIDWLEAGGECIYRPAQFYSRHPESILKILRDCLEKGEERELLVFKSGQADLGPPYRQRGAVVLRTEMAMIAEVSIYRYIPVSTLDYWANDRDRHLTRLALWAADGLGFNVTGGILAAEELDRLRWGNAFPGESLRRQRGIWKPWQYAQLHGGPANKDAWEFAALLDAAERTGFAGAVRAMAAMTQAPGQIG
jgi:hypothetical protein